MRGERFAFLVVLAILVGLPAGLLGYEYGLRPLLAPRTVQVIDLVAHLPRDGGWSRDALRVQAGQRVRLRLRSEDVTHGFAIGRTDVGPVDIKPGEVTELEFVIDEPGSYQFYCTRWCEHDHWRMRGTLEVVGAGGNLPLSDRPLAPYLQAGLDIDAPHAAQVTPEFRPSARAGAALDVSWPAGWDVTALTPERAYIALRADARYAALSDPDSWNLVARAWRAATDDQALARGGELYAANCAACHGPEGRGDGPGARYLQDPRPADFTATQMAGASSLLLHGKIVRGGMGTSMPYWGPIFTEAEQWALVDLIWSLWFEYGAE